jgi:hypothetical protein
MERLILASQFQRAERRVFAGPVNFARQKNPVDFELRQTNEGKRMGPGNSPARLTPLRPSAVKTS